MRAACAALLICACGGGESMLCMEGVGGSGGFGGFGGDGGGVFATGGGSGGGIQGPNLQVLLSGTPQTVTLSLAPQAMCGSKRQATSVRTTIAGPDNLPVTHTNSGVDNGGSDVDPYTTTVTFTPAQAGDYHFVATFEPNLGLVQLDLPAALNFTKQPALFTFNGPLLKSCFEHAVTANGLLLCSETSGQLSEFRGDQRLAQIPAVTFSVEGNSVWVATNAPRLLHYVDTGSGALVEDPAAQLDLVESPTLLLPQGEAVSVVAVFQSGAARYSAMDAGFFSDRTWSVSTFSVETAAADHDALLIGNISNVYGNYDGGTELSIGPFADQLGFGPEGLWVEENSSPVLMLLRPGHTSPATLNYPASWTTESLRYGVRPFLSGIRHVVAHYDAMNEQLFFADWGGAPDVSVEARRDFAIFTPPDGGDVVVKKTPAP